MRGWQNPLRGDGVLERLILPLHSRAVESPQSADPRQYSKALCGILPNRRFQVLRKVCLFDGPSELFRPCENELLPCRGCADCHVQLFSACGQPRERPCGFPRFSEQPGKSRSAGFNVLAIFADRLSIEETFCQSTTCDPNGDAENEATRDIEHNTKILPEIPMVASRRRESSSHGPSKAC
jgi:hypothetical protein